MTTDQAISPFITDLVEATVDTISPWTPNGFGGVDWQSDDGMTIRIFTEDAEADGCRVLLLDQRAIDMGGASFDSGGAMRELNLDLAADYIVSLASAVNSTPLPHDGTVTVKLDKARALVAEHGAVDLELVGLDGNAFMVIGAVSKAARRADWPADAREALCADMMSGDYDHLLQVAMVASGDIS